MTVLKAENISYKIGHAILLKETSVAFAEGQFHVVMGANGAGKSTLLKILAGTYKPITGSVFLEDKELTGFNKNILATKRAVLSQHYHLPFPITVEEIVLMGRYPYFATQSSAKDKAICKEAMQLMDVSNLAQRDYTTLSGGEAQKVQMCRVLSQIGEVLLGEKKILFLDEPVSHLDMKYQHQLLAAAKKLCQSEVTVVAVLHDINLAIKFADRMLFMKKGEIRYDLLETSRLTSEIIEDVFDVSSSIVYTEENKPVVVL
ncbi:MAG: heme ABC transporter ATP-binding protein [Chitinophagaceae bacterium]|nr:MAG: heme ABC transporter ATP-binding protein [Chitinophagaceae bacterium]